MHNLKFFNISKRLWRDYVRQHLAAIILTGLLLIISSAATSAQPLLIQQAFDSIFKQRDLKALQLIPALIVVVFIVQGISLYWSGYIMGIINNAMITKMRQNLFAHIMENELEFYSKNDSGSLLSRIVSEILHIANAITHGLNVWCRQVTTSLGLLAVMLYQSVELTFLSLIVFILAYYPLRRITTRLKKLTRQLSDRNAELNSRLIESLGGIRTVKSFRKEEFEIKKIASYIEEIENYSNKTNSISIITTPMLQIFGGIAVAFVIWFGGHSLIEGKMTEGNLVAFIASLMMFVRPVRSLTSAGGVMVRGYVAADRFFSIIDSKPRFISRDHGNELKINKAEFSFNNVCFEYEGGALAVDNVSFIAEAGKKTALVGHSGSGKSTLFNLIMKFYEPTSGTVFIDGQNISQCNIDSVRKNIALVSQDIFIFDDTALNNIGYGKEGASYEEIVKAAQAAHCHDFIMQLPQGYNTRLGFAGETLSGGQKQRIAIARAFLRDAPILLLDEATSALDPRTESDIQDSLLRLSTNRTTIIIAHRLSTVINADKMILMNEGKVAATGTHEQLLKESELYRAHFGL